MLKNNKGITLVELLIVIVILGIIAAIAVPAVGNIVENARVDAFISEGRTIASSANVACTTEEYDGCSAWPSDTTEWSDEDYLTEDQLVNDGYLEGLDEEASFRAFRSDGTWYVAWEVSGNNGYFAAGNPANIERGNVVPFESSDDQYGGVGSLDEADDYGEGGFQEFMSALIEDTIDPE